MHRLTNLLVATAAVLLGAAAVAFALTSGPPQTPSASDLPRIVAASAPATGAVAATPTVVPGPAPTRPAPKGDTARTAPSPTRVSPRPAGESDRSDEAPTHETVSPPVHESDGNTHSSESKSD